MNIVICASIVFTPQIKKVADQLLQLGHSIEIPKYSKKILDGEITLEEFITEKQAHGDGSFREKSDEDLIKRYYKLIEQADAILVLNIDKKDVHNYIGANTFLEMGFAYVLDKKIFLYNDIPDMMHKDEVVAMKPIILNQDLSIIR